MRISVHNYKNNLVNNNYNNKNNINNVNNRRNSIDLFILLTYNNTSFLCRLWFFFLLLLYILVNHKKFNKFIIHVENHI